MSRDQGHDAPPPRVACVGAAAIDRKFRLLGPAIAGTSNPATASVAFGGVARNVCENLARLGHAPLFFSALGNDAAGHDLARHLNACGAVTAHLLHVDNTPTAEYVAILDTAHNLQMGVFGAGAFDRLDRAYLQASWPAMADASWIFADCNTPPDALAWLLTQAHGHGIRVAVDTVSVPKARRLRGLLACVALLVTNRDEALHLLPEGPGMTTADMTTQDLATALVRAGAGAGTVIVTEGAAGLSVADARGARAIPAHPATVADVTGAGDALIGATLGALLDGAEIDTACRLGAAAAALTIESRESVRPDLSRALVHATARLPSPGAIKGHVP
ncbi:PfkB family carbohydrate kinase [Gluconacetobacter tumulicola]|uniref:Sugar kinase n=1 Tax=Gluconacetobacter tumulicola TaxID=1017177 RepID=A0A7W4JEQ6_9PROT|nr:sugar kinase [Gluconacetobacter tumulicola]